MVKYKYMSVLISICIFVLGSYLLVVPARPYIVKNMDKLVENDNYLYLQSLTKMPVNDENNLVFLKNYKTNNVQADETGTLVCKNMGTETVDGVEVEKTLYKTSLEYTNKDGMIIHFDFVIDLFDEDNNPQYYPEREFVYSNEKFPDVDKKEYYLIVFWKDSIYYQAHPFNIASANVVHDDVKISTLSQKLSLETLKVLIFLNLRMILSMLKLFS